jgi:ribosomal-protein-alanine N-acetyltransferase
MPADTPAPFDPATLTLRRMTPADLPAVAAVERAAFENGWPATAFAHELEQNAMARYLLVELVPPGEGQAPVVLGFAGLWLIVDEAHVVTVAVTPPCRRHGLGRLLVHALVTLARDCGMTDATLECRVSNQAARALYRDYGFHEVGLRKHYYADNGEDAVIMTTEAFSSEGYRARLARLEARLAAMLPGAPLRLVEG